MNANYGSVLLNDGWTFTKLLLGSTREEALAAGWQRVTLPHDWLIWQAADLYESADAWYRRTLRKEEADAETVILCFDGVYMDCDVLLNGEILRTHPYGYTAFQVNLSGKLADGENELMVHIRHRSPNTRWYSGSGIYRDVTLRLLPESYLIPDSLYTVTEREGDAWRITVMAEAAGSGEFRARLLDPEGKQAAEGSAPVEEGKAVLSLTVSAGQTWSPAHPALYTLEYGLGAQRETVRVGLRETRFDPDEGFFLNGEHLKLKGVCLHHDLGALGAAFHPAAARRQLRIMREMGANALRTSHNPPARRMLDLCDEMGILVVDEIFDMWERPKTDFDYARFFPEYEAEDVASWIRRDRNHACVVMWSIGNEIYDMFADDRGREVTRMLRDQVLLHDPRGHARVTFGSNYMPWEGAQRCAEEVGVPGYNYAEKHYAGHHEKHPDWVIYGSETASVLSSRGIYHFPLKQTILSDADQQCSALGNSFTSWGAQSLKKMLVDDLKTPYSMGQFVWSGFDYIGEPTPYHTRSCYFGQVDTAGFPKDAFYLFRSLWGSDPMVHIGVSWDWNPGQMIDIPVMSSCPRVELLLNGESLGTREIDSRDEERCTALWRLPFTAGRLEAVGRNREGEILCRDSRVTPGETAALRLTAERETLPTDGSDLAFITVEAVDGQGNPVENARDRLRVSVTGGGMLLGLDNGDSTDPDEYKGTTKRLFGGKMLIIAGGSGKPEPARIEVRSTAGAEGRLVIPTVGAACAPAFGPEIPESPENPEIPVRRVEIIPLEGCELGPEKRTAEFAWKAYPENATDFSLEWQITTAGGIVNPCAEASAEGNRVRVTAKGDGEVLLRALYGNAADHPERISQTELRIQGMGRMMTDPYEFVTAGLHDLQEGEIGAGNEQGISFAREGGDSMVGFSRVDFGPAGSDTLTLDLFTLNDELYRIRLYGGDPRTGGRLITVLEYQKPSVWNVYQPETYVLPERLTGVHTLCFVGENKFHFRGFRFLRQSRAFVWQRAGQADTVYGDSFRRDGDAVREIGNNVTLTWEQMDFGESREAGLVVEGRTPLEMTAITLRMENDEGASVTEVIRFPGPVPRKARFRVPVPGGNTKVSFIFLPGSQFDFEGFRFER